jgi:hypothetical protein
VRLLACRGEIATANARLRALLPAGDAILGVDLADAKQAVVLTDHDSRVLARPAGGVPGLAARRGPRLGGREGACCRFVSVTVVCEPIGHRWRILDQLAVERGLALVCVQPLLVWRARETEDLTCWSVCGRPRWPPAGRRFGPRPGAPPWPWCSPAATATGSVDVLVNNAGFSWIGPTAELDLATFDRLFTANVRAPYFLVAALAPKMAARGSGSIINIGSQSGQIGMAGLAADSATKGALAALTRSWAAEFSPAGVRINTVVSGPVYTGIRPDSVTEAVGATTLMARAAQPDEIASVIVFLASPQASYITGAVFAADGGRTAI